jgi:DNA-binding beta-propeller fold protein YncE
VKRFLLVVLLAACRPSSDPSAPAPALTYAQSEAWPDHSTYPGVGGGRLLVTNDREDTVSLFDLTQVGQATLPELARVPVGLNPVEIEAPHHAAISPDGKFYFIGLSEFAPGSGSGPHGAHGSGAVDGQILKVRSSDNRLVASARVDRNPGDLTVSPDGKLLAVSHFDLLRISEAARGVAPDPFARLALLDADSMQRVAMVSVCAAPHGSRFSRDGKQLYLACYDDQIAIVQMDKGDGTYPVTRVKVAGNAGDAFSASYQPYGVAVSPLTGDVFISCIAHGEVRVLNATTMTIDTARTTAVSGNPLLADFSADGNTLFVPHQGDDQISVIDPSTGAQTRSMAMPHPGCINVHMVTVLPGGQLAVVCEGDHVTPGNLLIVDASSGTVVSDTPVGIFPDYVGVIR